MKNFFKNGGVVCPACKGKGAFYVSESEPLEINRLPNKVNCLMCKGDKYFYADTKLVNACKAFWESYNKG